MSVVDVLQEVTEEICDKYCKYPEQYASRNKDEDKAYEIMLKEKCENCPLSKIY